MTHFRTVTRLLAIFFISSPVVADGIRCGQRLVEEGDSRVRLLRICGEPEYRETFTETVYAPVHDRIAGDTHAVPFQVVTERWTYDFGTTRFMRVVTLRYGKVVRIETGDRF